MLFAHAICVWKLVKNICVVLDEKKYQAIIIKKIITKIFQIDKFILIFFKW